MPKYKDRVVILCVVFNYRKFIGLKLYNIDKNSFIDVFKNELYLYDIWGLSDNAKAYLYKHKKLEEEPKFDIGFNYVTEDYRCLKDFIGYKNLPLLDVGTGEIVNIDNQVISHIYNDNWYNWVDYRHRLCGQFLSKSLCNKRQRGLVLTNVTEESRWIVPLNMPFYTLKEDVSEESDKKGKISLNEEEIYKFEKENLTFEANEIRNQFRRKIDTFLSDKVNKSQDVKEREFLRRFYLGCSKDFESVLIKKGYQDIFKDKKYLNEIAKFIDTEKLLFEFDNLNEAPCGDKICSNLIKDIKQTTNNLGSYSGRQKEVANLFEAKSKGVIFRKSRCKTCYTMLNMYGLTYIVNDERIRGLSPNNVNMPESVFINVTDDNVFSLRSMKTLVHEEMHDLSKNLKNNKGGIVDFNDKYKNAYIALNEGITEILACYFIHNELKKRNVDKIPFKYDNTYLLYDDYQKKLNPYLKSFDSLYPEVEGILSSNGVTDKRILNSYKYNVYLILRIMKDIGVRNVINCYFIPELNNFETLCTTFYGKEKWKNFLINVNKYKEIDLEAYKTLKILL